eukprot:g321.t1
MPTLTKDVLFRLGTKFFFQRLPSRRRLKRLSVLVLGSSNHEWKQHSFYFAERIDNAFYEACIENLGRPAAAALADFVIAVLQCAQSGLSTDAIYLELQLINHESTEHQLTSSDHYYRKQWILAIFMTRALYHASLLGTDSTGEGALESWKLDHPALVGVVWVIWRGLLLQDQSSMVQFDRSLATRGLSGGVATETRSIPPQFVPISQIVLLTLKHLDETKQDDDL